MSNILLVEPDYRSKFPPLGLLRISTFHKEKGDSVTFTRGRNFKLRNLKWHRIYISSLFTYELPRTLDTIKYYLPSVDTPKDIFVGGIGVTLNPEFIENQVSSTVIRGHLDRLNILGGEKRPIAEYIPDYSIIKNSEWKYIPEDSYFCRTTIGCIRKCKFCAVPLLEPKFKFHQKLKEQVKKIKFCFGEKQHLILLDNNILASEGFGSIVDEIVDLGFERGAIRENRRRHVDFNQGIDARLIDTKMADILSRLSLFPVRLAFDHLSIEKKYVRAINLLAVKGFQSFTNYIMYNFRDDPQSFYYRLRMNVDLSTRLGIRITSFPMKFIPIEDINRRYVDPGWHWRYLRGIQCVLLATHGLVSPNQTFFDAAFGSDYEEFCEILSMPDRYIIFRDKYSNDGAKDWKRHFRRLSPNSKEEFLEALSVLNRAKDKKSVFLKYKKFKNLLEHYYPNGKPIECV